MSFLTSIVVAVITWLLSQLEKAGLDWWRHHEDKLADNKKDEEQAKKDADAIKGAQDDKTRSDAVKHVIDDTFRR